MSKIWLFGALSALALGCGEEDKKESTSATTSLKYADVKALVNANCASSGCHASGGQSPDLSTAALNVTHASSAASQISKGLMPTAASKAKDFESSGAKDKLLEWYKAGAPN